MFFYENKRVGLLYIHFSLPYSFETFLERGGFTNFNKSSNPQNVCVCGMFDVCMYMYDTNISETL